jgi:CRISPR-associated protein (Cas_Csm6)
MASIILSFVGTQDPYSDQTNEEGSIVTLVKHLSEQNKDITHIFLLFTQDLQERAEITQQWLKEEAKITAKIELISVDPALSEDPIDIPLCTTAAKQALTLAKAHASIGDTFEFNASSGTPAMKSTWSVLQASGYAPHSRVWQVRNPHEMRAEQPRVFAADLSGLKAEFDRNIIQQQLTDYNYSGALATIENSGLNDELVTALLSYGHRRLCFDFDRAQNAIGKYKKTLPDYLFGEIAELRQKNLAALLKELYFGADIKIKNQNYSDFLTIVSQFQENFLRLLMTNVGLEPPIEHRDINTFWSKVRGFDNGNLYQQLVRDKISTDSWVYVKAMSRIVEYTSQYTVLLQASAKLQAHCQDRNNYIHKLAGISQLDKSDVILNDLRNMLKQLTPIPDLNTFDRLNQDILDRLEIDRSFSLKPIGSV